METTESNLTNIHGDWKNLEQKIKLFEMVNGEPPIFAINEVRHATQMILDNLVDGQAGISDQSLKQIQQYLLNARVDIFDTLLMNLNMKYSSVRNKKTYISKELNIDFVELDSRLHSVEEKIANARCDKSQTSDTYQKLFNSDYSYFLDISRKLNDAKSSMQNNSKNEFLLSVLFSVLGAALITILVRSL